jgi:small subunit ribosomal protein S8
MKDNLYLGDIEEIGPSNHKTLKINLIKRINKCGAIKPRFAVASDGYEKFEKRYLIAKGFRHNHRVYNKGKMTHTEAKEKGLGGRLWPIATDESRYYRRDN